MAVTAHFSKTPGVALLPWAFFVVFVGIPLIAFLLPRWAQAGEQYRELSGQGLDQQLGRGHDFGGREERLVLKGQVQGFLDGGRTQIPVVPDPRPVVVFDNKPLRINIDSAKVNSCRASAQELKKLKPLLGDKKYAEALLDYDQHCLSRVAAKSDAFDPAVAKRAMVIMSRVGQGLCTGLLLDEATLATARHCFVVQSSGRVRQEFQTFPFAGIEIQSVDQQRHIFISKETVEALAATGSFDIDKDPIKVPVTVTKEPGAAALPTVVFKTPVVQQLLWVAGPMALLDRAIAMRTIKSGLPHYQWQDAFRWSAADAAQCRIEAIGPACIYHTCQTSPGYSGSPMISAAYRGSAGDFIEFVGIHSGSPGWQDDEGWPACMSAKADFKASEYSFYNVGKNGGF